MTESPRNPCLATRRVRDVRDALNRLLDLLAERVAERLHRRVTNGVGRQDNNVSEANQDR